VQVAAANYAAKQAEALSIIALANAEQTPAG